MNECIKYGWLAASFRDHLGETGQWVSDHVQFVEEKADDRCRWDAHMAP